MYQQFFKRFFDICGALLLCVPVLLVIIIVGPLIYLEDRGSIFYNAQRVGRQGQPFKMFKLRSMYVNAPDIRLADGSTYNGEDDPRVTRIGKLIRKASIDELPQVFNVLIGDMSFIGPRPNLVSVPYEELPEIEQRRLAVRPGITGYNQAYFRNSIPAEERFLHDVYYVEHLTFLFDVKIIFQTIKTVIKQENINSQGIEQKDTVSAAQKSQNGR